MLTHDEEKFLAWWVLNREKQKTSLRPLMMGLSAGLVLGIAVVVTLETGWDQRATMVANASLSSFVLLLAIVIVAGFFGVLYRKFRWEMQEQQYLELKAKKTRQEKAA